MFNQFREESSTRGGRIPRPTPKVRQQLIDTVSRELRNVSNELRLQEKDLRKSMQEGCPPSQVHHMYSKWCTVLDDFDMTEQELRSFLVQQDLLIHERIVERKQKSIDEFRHEVSCYLSQRTSVLPSSSSKAEFVEETRRLEADLKEISARLEKAQLSVEGSHADLSDNSSVSGDTRRRPPPYKHRSTPVEGDEKQNAETRFVHPLHDEFSGLSWEEASCTNDSGRRRVNSSEGSTLKALEKLAELIDNKKDRLPKLEPDVFAGDMLKFPVWVKSFEMLVEKNTSVPAERLFYLGKYTSGEAHEAIVGFLCLFSDDAYVRAKSVLKVRFGDKVQVAQAYKTKLSRWSNIKKGDGSELRRLADFLWQCNAAMETVRNLQSLGTPEEISRVLRLLPNHLVERWDRVVDRYYYNGVSDPTTLSMMPEGEYPPFCELCKFVSHEARVLNGPGRALRGDGRETTTHDKGKKVQALATEAKESKRPWSKGSSGAKKSDQAAEKGDAPGCYFCSEAHVITKCETFLRKPAHEKREFALFNSLCFGCLSKSHAYRDCQAKKPSLLKEYQGEAVQTLNTSVIDDDAGYYTLVVPVIVCDPNNPARKKKVYSLLDTQANGCFVAQDLAEWLHLDLQSTRLELVTMGSTHVVDSQVALNMQVAGVGGQSVLLPKVYAQEEIPSSTRSVPTVQELKKWKHLKKLAHGFPDEGEDAVVSMLIGCNVPGVFVPRGCAYAGDDRPFGIHTSLGWGIMGKRPGAKQPHTCLRTTVKEVTAAEVSRAFDMDFQGHEDDLEKVSQDDRLFLKVVEDSLNYKKDGHFEMALPLRDIPTNMPNNRDVAFKQLMGQKKRFIRDPEYLRKYHECIQGTIDDGFAEPAPAQGKVGKVNYSPHHGVEHPRKPGVVRVVSNFSSIKCGVSLNQKLLSGPDLTNNLVGVVIRFREERIAFMCDVRKMFYQVGVVEPDRDYLRFLWFAGGDPEGEVVDMRMCVHPFGATSSPTCANYAIKATADRFEDVCGEEAANFLRRGFYVDDGLGSKPTTGEVVKLFMAAHDMCGKGGFFLTKFTCNSREAMEQVAPHLLATSAQQQLLTGGGLPTETSLGIKWDMDLDCFVFIVGEICRALTRRGMLSALSSVFDPVGFLAPVILVGRLMLQRLCHTKVSWDDELEESVKDEWTIWYRALEELRSLQIPRCYRNCTEGEIVSVQMHHFCDASTAGFGACSYVRLTDCRGEIDVALVAAKARVGPKKAVTMPRMELQGAVVSTKLARFLIKEMPYAKMSHHYWSDSKVVLGYIANASRRFHLYVANRAGFIRENSEVTEWRYVRSEDNPADLASRGCSVAELSTSKLWWKGPNFLMRENWAVEPESYGVDENDPELKGEKIVVHKVKMQVQGGQRFLASLSGMASWFQIVARLTVWVRYCYLLRVRINQRSVGDCLTCFPESRVQQVQVAERALVRAMQVQAFPEEWHMLNRCRQMAGSRDQEKTKKMTLKHSSPLYSLDPFLDEHDVLRVGGRLVRSNLPSALIQPMIVPQKSEFVDLLIVHHHLLAAHPGRQATLAAIRSAGFWVIHGRSRVEKVTRDCVICKRIRGVPVVQKMADLPEERLQEVPPFSYCGMDVFGPFQVKERRAQVKRWICVFICFSSLAVHLEVLYEMSADSFLNAFRRFQCRRGPVRTLYSDRGTNFVGAANELRAALSKCEYAKVHAEVLRLKCDWVDFKFNSPKSSHMGGIWERAIRTLRAVLTSIMLKSSNRLTNETFHTFIVEAEGIANSKPLTSLDLTDPLADPPLSPSMLLTMKSNVGLPPPGEFS